MPSASEERGADGSTDAQQLFLAHAYPDREIVQRIADGLVALGSVGGWTVETVVDEATLFLGDSLLERVAATIGKRGYVAVALSGRSVGARWVQEEVRSLVFGGEGNGIVLLPLLVADCELPEFLEDRFFADFRRPESFQESLDLIVRRLGFPDTLAPLKRLGLVWEGPFQFSAAEVLTLSLVYFDGSVAVAGSPPRVPAGIHVPANLRLANLSLFEMALPLPLDFGEGECQFVHFESESSLRPHRTLARAGLASGDHLVVAVGPGASLAPEAIVRRVKSVVQDHQE